MGAQHPRSNSNATGATELDVSLVVQTGLQFDLTTPQGRLIAQLMAALAEFERDLVSERVRSGLAAAKARGKVLGRQPGQRPKSDRLTPQVIQMVEEKVPYRTIAHDLKLSKTTVTEIVKRHRQAHPDFIPLTLEWLLEKNRPLSTSSKLRSRIFVLPSGDGCRCVVMSR